MRGAGFIKDMINVTRSNRTLLRGDDSAKYKNFDREAYLSKSRLNRIPNFKTASPEYLAELRRQLTLDNARSARVKRSIMLLSIGFCLLLLALLFVRF